MILENMATKPTCSPVVNALIINESMAVQMIQRKTTRLFQDYCEDVFIPYTYVNLQHVRRLDVVFDVYKASTLKSSLRQTRRQGTRLRVALSTNVPWK